MAVKTPAQFTFDLTLPRGHQHDHKAGQFVIVAELTFPNYGRINSMRMGTYRNGQRVYDISLATYGCYLDMTLGLYKYKFQLRDGNVDRLEDNEYRIHAIFDFLPEDDNGDKK